MRILPKSALLLASVHALVIAAPAYAQAPAPQPAPAPAVGSDVIHLKGGGILRGTLIDAIPHMQARIQLATGEIATVPWDQIDQIEHASTPGPGPAPGPSTAPTTPAPKPPAPSATVFVHIEGSDDVQLLQDKSGDGDWATVCYAPCDKPLPTGPMYRIDGSGIKQSSSFHLAATDNGQHESIAVHGASTAWFIIGCIAVPIGGIAGYFGLVLGLTGSLLSSADSSGATGGVAAAGWTTFAIGAAAVVGGVLLVVTNMKTTVSQDVAGGPAAAILHADAYKRLPSWSETTPIDRAMPPVVGIPLVHATF